MPDTSSDSNREKNNHSKTSTDSELTALKHDGGEDIKESFAKFRLNNKSVSEKVRERDKPSSAYSNDYPNSESASASETKSKRAVSISDAEVTKFEFDDTDRIFTDGAISERISEYIKS